MISSAQFGRDSAFTETVHEAINIGVDGSAASRAYLCDMCTFVRFPEHDSTRAMTEVSTMQGTASDSSAKGPVPSSDILLWKLQSRWVCFVLLPIAALTVKRYKFAQMDQWVLGGGRAYAPTSLELQTSSSWICCVDLSQGQLAA